jgi:hypothetical protein
VAKSRSLLVSTGFVPADASGDGQTHGVPRIIAAINGRELVYRVDDGIMAASIEAVGDSIRTGKPTRLFTGNFRGGTSGVTIGGNNFADYDVSADGQRFVMFPTSDSEFTNRGIVTLVTQWSQELTRTFTSSR